MVSGRGCERDGVGEQRAAAGGDALAALPAPGPHLRGALRAAQGDRATVGGMVSGRAHLFGLGAFCCFVAFHSEGREIVGGHSTWKEPLFYSNAAVDGVCSFVLHAMNA